MSIKKTVDDGNIPIFTKDGITVHKEQDVLITCKGAPILTGKRDKRGCYCIPLIQWWGQWQRFKATKKSRKFPQEANIVSNLQSTEQAIKWMHSVCRYPVKSTWFKAIKTGNFVGWTLLTKVNVTKHYPKTNGTPKGHMSQIRKNVRSTGRKPTQLKVSDTTTLRGKTPSSPIRRGSSPSDPNEAISTSW